MCMNKVTLNGSQKVVKDWVNSRPLKWPAFLQVRRLRRLKPASKRTGIHLRTEVRSVLPVLNSSECGTDETPQGFGYVPTPLRQKPESGFIPILKSADFEIRATAVAQNRDHGNPHGFRGPAKSSKISLGAAGSSCKSINKTKRCNKI